MNNYTYIIHLIITQFGFFQDQAFLDSLDDLTIF